MINTYSDESDTFEYISCETNCYVRIEKISSELNESVIVIT